MADPAKRATYLQLAQQWHELAESAEREAQKAESGPLRRRSQTSDLLWARMARLADDWLPKPKILHPWPEARLAVRHPR